jgi:hypothetical protein
MMSVRTTIGSIIGLSTPYEFTFAVKPGGVHLHDFVAIDVQESSAEPVKRCWAKVIKLERFNPLLPREAGHEIASMGIEAVETIVSLSREFVTAQGQILGIDEEGNVSPLTYPVKHASSVYIPQDDEVQRLLIGNVEDHRRIKVGNLRGRNIEAVLDAHYLVSRHLAIFAMTGAGKSWTCRKILEMLMEKQYPIIIFDPHGDYAGMKKTEGYADKVEIYFPVIHFESWDVEDITKLVENLSGSKFTEAQEPIFVDAYNFVVKNEKTCDKLRAQYKKDFGVELYRKSKAGYYNIFSVIKFLEAVINIKNEGMEENYSDFGIDSIINAQQRSIFSIIRKCTKMGGNLQTVQAMNKMIAKQYGVDLQTIPEDLSTLVQKGKVSIISLSGYSELIQSAILSQVLENLLQAKVKGEITLPFLSVIEEAHNFAPSTSEGISESYASLDTLKKIATEGRKFGMGLILISQRPSRLHPTVSSQCNSFIVLRIVNPADQKYIRDIIETMGEHDVELLPELAIGEALITGQITRFPILARIDPPKSQGTREEKDLIKTVMDST